MLESDPGSEARQDVIKEDLQKAGAREDEELLHEAQGVLQAVEQHAPEATAEIHVNLEYVKAAGSIKIADLLASGGVDVDVRKTEAGRDIEIKGIRAGNGGDEAHPK